MRIPVGYKWETSSLQVFELYVCTPAQVHGVSILGQEMGRRYQYWPWPSKVAT